MSSSSFNELKEVDTLRMCEVDTLRMCKNQEEAEEEEESEVGS